MRIIAGRWKGRRLQTPKNTAFRPTTDRTKEALFNILGPAVQGCVVVDLCCGAGGLGLEALSRGAELVIFVDSAAASLGATQVNLALCGADTDTYRLESGEAVSWLQRWPGCGGQRWILLCDPPYQSTAAAAMMTVVETEQLPAGLLCAVIEHGTRTPDLPTISEQWQTRRYGESHLAVFRPGQKSKLERKP